MRLPATATLAGARAMRGLLAEPSSALVGLDFDGTLSPIVEDPSAARPAEGAPGILRRLARHLDTLAIVTGRPAFVAAALLGFQVERPANLVVLGHYGLERLTSSGIESAPGSPAVELVRTALPALLAEVGAPPGTAVEDKQHSIAVHVRRTADPTAATALLRPPLSALAAAHGLRLEPGRMVLEIRPAGVDKGVALEALVRERGAKVVWYAGDDLGDIAAFDALERLRGGGIAALTICSASAEVTKLADRADLVVPGPEGLVEFLGGVCRALDDAVDERT